MSLLRIFAVVAFGCLALVAVSIPTSAQSQRTNAVRLDITKLTRTVPVLLNGKTVRGKSLLDVLREAQPNGATVLNVFFHSNSTTIRDIAEVLATADKQGGFAERHTFVSCSDKNQPAWCEVTLGKPVSDPE